MMRWRYRETVLALCTLAFFVTMYGRVAISPVVPSITEEFGVSNAVIGVALTGMWLAYGLSQFPSGVLGDRYGERVVILVALGGTAVASVLIAVAPVFGIFVVATVILGAVAGLHYSVATTLLSRIHDNVGTAIGIHNSGATIAGLVAPLIVAWVGVTYGWRAAIVTTAVVGVPAFALFALLVKPTEPRRPEQSMRDQFDLASLLEILSRPVIAFTLFVAIVGEFVWQGAASFLPVFLIEHREYSPTLAATGFSAYFVAQGIAQVGVGAVSDRFGRDRATAGCLLLGAIGLWLLVAGPGLVSAAVGVLLLGIGMSFEASLLPRFLNALGDEERGTGFGLVRTVYVITASLGSVIVGLIADFLGWGVAFAFLAGLLLLAVIAFAANWLFSLDL
ncbi:major facilitator superfamily transport protein (plasmid) [Natrialba magadii ATCC 43099]|uniref:Major facilitator superfamily protein n=1 Tax=Natrialba magadii (strain ATCC 43099 / DSM 3394 / CCM 3739 / CIP 104546 / IAM 13178 / JCM 8861 / NBRC 102185 / NCIMB 2190 / MS3) TaxID=547559 RepID=D3T1L2_NATMM|nr:MFS transporter [Natrialba magadii]ADD07471.1 major facilitator superfamily transport protein [Natrialba magadii ATCC 43099]ELY32189.1 major facilitator superfamily protein [Natrialba magadii ATCC 43099]